MWPAYRHRPTLTAFQYYQVFWEEALQYRRSSLAEDAARQLVQYAAHLMLVAIGVTGEPVAPDTEFEQLGDVDPAFLSGAVQPARASPARTG